MEGFVFYAMAASIGNINLLAPFTPCPAGITLYYVVSKGLSQQGQKPAKL